MREINKIAESLFEKIRDRFEDVSLGDENAKATQNPEDARFFNFDYVVDGQNYGNITLSIIDEVSLKVYFSKNISEKLEGQDRQDWYHFLRELREFAKRNILSFEPRDITRSTLKHRDVQQVSKADSTYDKDEVIGESRLYGTSRSSYENDGNVRLIVRHTDRVNPEQRGARARKIKSIYVETSEGERLKLPHNNLRYARAMARHVSEGGMMGDEFGQYITSIAEECNKLRPFKNSVRRRTFEDSETQAMVEAAFEYHSLLNNTLKRMGGSKGYQKCKESFNANESVLMDDFDLDEMRERFVKRVYKDEMDEALPIVQKAYKMKKENKFASMFEQWAEEVSEGTWELPESDTEVDKLIELMKAPLAVGIDAANASNALYDIIGDDELFDELLNMAEDDPEQDVRPVVFAWLESNHPDLAEKISAAIEDTEEVAESDTGDAPIDSMSRRELLDYLNVNPEQVMNVSDDELRAAANEKAESMAEGNVYGASGMDEPVVNEDEDQVEMITNAIVRRILGNVKQHSKLIMKAGPDGVMNAARDVASFHAPVEELGSSDISNMVREVYNEVGVEYPELNEGKVKQVSMDLEELTDEEFKAKYGKTKDEMKAALSETQGQDYVNRDEKLKRAGAKELGVMDKLKNIPRGMKAMARGDSEDDLVLYNKSKAQVEEDITDIKRLAGL